MSILYIVIYFSKKGVRKVRDGNEERERKKETVSAVGKTDGNK